MSKALLLEAHLKRLRMPTVASLYLNLAREAETNNETYESYLLALLDAEVQQRDINVQKARMKRAKFPTAKTLEEFDFSALPEINSSRFLTLAHNSYIEKKENILLIGPCGVGKTHLPIGLGIAACRARKKVRFITTPALVNELVEARENHKLSRVEASFAKLDLLILDEFGFVPFPKDGAELLFHLIASKYERGSIILTSNLEFSKWTDVMGDQALAGAFVDRLTHHAHIIQITGDSYRFKNSLQTKKKSKKKS